MKCGNQVHPALTDSRSVRAGLDWEPDVVFVWPLSTGFQLIGHIAHLTVISYPISSYFPATSTPTVRPSRRQYAPLELLVSPSLSPSQLNERGYQFRAAAFQIRVLGLCDPLSGSVPHIQRRWRLSVG